MTLTEYITSLNLTPDAIDEMPEERAKQLLKVILAVIEDGEIEL